MDPAWQILATKVFLPPPPPTLVVRPRLIEKLRAVFQHPLTTVITPAGFGKTTLISLWASQVIAEKQASIAWLTLDPSDDNPSHFWASVVAAFRTIDPTLGRDALPHIKVMSEATDSASLTPLVNQLAGYSDRPIVLVLDDFHLIHSQAVHTLMAFFVDHLPPHVHVIVNARSDPALPLSRLRARRQLAELRATDLRFNTEEVASFLNDVMALRVAPELITILETRTEGWIAGLHLVALSMQNTSDPAAFVRSLTGSQRFIMDYLVEEVLQHQSPAVRTFLLQTAVVDRLCAPLCDAVTNSSGSAAMLTLVERANLFLVPLDDERRWYRYHQLFVEALRVRLVQETPESVPELHRRASIWYAQHASGETSLRGEAIRHALAAGDGERAVRLVSDVADTLWARNELVTLRAWLSALPETVLAQYPRQAVMLAQIVALTGSYEMVPLLLEPVTAALARPELPEDERTLLRGRIAAIHTHVSRVAERLDEALVSAEQALALLPHAETSGRGMALLGLSLIHHMSGDLEMADGYYRETIAQCEAGSDRYFELTARCMHSRLFIERGDLVGAEAAFRQALGRATYGTHRLPIAGWALVGLGTVAYARNELATSLAWFTEGLELVRRSGLRNAIIHGLAGLVRLRLAQGDLAGAQVAAADLVLATQSSQIPHFMRWAEALRALVDLRAGDLAAATRWALAFRPRPEALLFSDKAAYAIYIRVLLAQGQTASARQWINSQRGRAQLADHVESQVELLLLEALALYAEGDSDGAHASLDAALAQAEPAGYIRLFLDFGAPIGRLLGQSQGRGQPPKVGEPYRNRLLAAFQMEAALVRLARPALPVRQALLEPLSDRELEVLGLMAAGLSNQAIAARLVISVPTVKKHGSNILGKLYATNRTEAVSRARELGLLD